MRDLIKQVLIQELKSKKVLQEQVVEKGCDFFKRHTNDYRFCIVIENKLKNNTDIVSNAIYKYSEEYLSEYEKGVKAVKYDKELEFFSERRKIVKDALDKIKLSCPKLREYIIYRMVQFTEKYVIWNEENQYDLLNKLTTNYSAAAYLVTAMLPEYYKNNETPENGLRYFFEEKNKDGVTLFESFMGKIDKELQKEIREKIYKTIEYTTKKGQEVEDEFFKYITKQLGESNVINYSGDYSFMDMIGIDMIIKDPNGVWIPVQVKKSSGGCYDKTIKKTRPHMCENWCVSNSYNFWNIKVYDGGSEIYIKEQPKELPLDMTIFKNVDESPNIGPKDFGDTDFFVSYPEFNNLDDVKFVEVK